MFCRSHNLPLGSSRGQVLARRLERRQPECGRERTRKAVPTPSAGLQGRDLGNQILRGSQIMGATVNLRGGSRFGTVSDFVLADSGCVEYVIASYGNQYAPIPWGVAMWVPGQRVLSVDIDPGRIHDIPMYRRISELTNHQFSDKVHTFYRGVNGHGEANQHGAQQQGANNHAPAANPPAAGQAAGRPGVPAQGSQNRTGRNERNGDRR